MALNLEVNILGEYKNLTKATKGATKQLQGLQNSAKNISRGINGALAAIGVGISFNALRSGIQSVVTEASNLEQSLGAARIIFGQFSDQVIADSKAAAQEFGISANEYLQSANLINAQLKGYGLSSDEAAKQTTNLIERAADMAATFGGTTYEAVQALSAVFRGEYNQIERYSVTLRKSDINARLAAQGQNKLTGELLKQAEAQTALDLVTEKTAFTQGQNAAEADTLAGAMNRVRSSFANAKVEIGEGFAPAIAAIASFINKNIKVFDNLAKAVGDRVKSAFTDSSGAAKSFGAAIITTLTDLTEFLNGTADTDNAFVKLSESIAPVLELIGAFGELGKGIIAVLDGLFEGLFGWISLFTPAGKKVEGFAGFVEWLGSVLQEFGYWIGLVGSLFIPFTAGFKIAGKALGLFSKTIEGISKFLEKIFGGIGKFFDDVVKKGIDKFFGKNVSNAVIDAGDAAAGAAKGFGSLDNAASAALKQRDKWEKYKQFRLTNDLKFANAEAGILRTGLGTLSAGLDELNRKKTVIKIDMLVNGATVGEANRFGNLAPVPDLTDYNARAREYGEALRASLAEEVEEEIVPTGGAKELTTFQKRVQAVVDKLTETLQEAKDRIKNASENFRDAVGLSFGVISNGFTARFSVGKVIAQMKRIKDAVKTFSKDIIELRNKGADAALIDELISLGPLAGATAARELVTSGSLDEFLGLRKDLKTAGAAVGAAGNIAITGTSTSGLQNAIDGLNRTIAAGKGNTYNISIANPNITPQQIIAQIKAYEKKTGKKVFSN